MPPKKKLKSVVTEAIDDLTREYESEDDYDLNACKVSLGKSRNIKHWKKINQVFADEYEIDVKTLQRRSMHFCSLIPVENLENISQEWKDCFIEQFERFLIVNFNEWRIWPDDSITQVFEDYKQTKNRDDAIYRYMFRRINKSFITKAIISYTTLSSRKSHCLFYLLKYMTSICSNYFRIFKVIDFVYMRKNVTSNERTEFKKEFIFQIFPIILEKIIKKKGNKEWRLPFFYVLRMLMEIHYENHDPDKRVFKMVIHIFKKICSYRQYPNITSEYHNPRLFYNDLLDFQKGRNFPLTSLDDDSIKSDDTETESFIDSTNYLIFSTIEREAIVFHYLFLYVLSWLHYTDPCYDLCIMVEHFNFNPLSNDTVKKLENDQVIQNNPHFNICENVKNKFDSFNLMSSVKNFLNSTFPTVFDRFLQTTQLDKSYFLKQIDLNLYLIEGDYFKRQKLLEELLQETLHFPVCSFIDISISQIGNFIRIDKIEDALIMLISFSYKILKLFPTEEDYCENTIRKLPSNFISSTDKKRVIEVRTIDIDNLIDVLINFLMIILSKEIHEKKQYDGNIEKQLILCQHNWPQYSSLVDECFKIFQASCFAVVPNFREYTFQSNLIEEFSGLKHRFPNIKFALSEDKRPLSSSNVQQIFLEQMEKSMDQLPAMFFLKFILKSFPIPDQI